MPPTGLKGTALNRVRANAVALMPDLGTLRGMKTDRTFGVLASNVRYRIDSPGGRAQEQVARDMQVITSFYVLTTPYDVPQAVGNQFTLANGAVYEIFYVLAEASPLVVKTAYIRQADQMG